MDNAALDMNYILSAIRRRIWYFLIPTVLISVAALAVAVYLPPVYRSEGTILIEAQGIPQDFVRTTVNSYIDQRLQTISQIVQSRSNLVSLLNQFNLYAKDREDDTTAELVDRMRENIFTETIAGVDPDTGKETVTVAYTVGFQGENPRQVREVANRLISLYLEENMKTRTEQAETTYKFLEERLAELEAEIKNTEAKLAEFKEEHLHTLPELMELNLNNLERTRDNIAARQELIKSLINRQVVLEEQLGVIEPNFSNTSTQTEVESLRNQYVALKATLSPNHPDVIRLKSQLESLGAVVDSEGALEEKNDELIIKRQQLATAESKYADKHPDVVRLRKEVAELEKSIDELGELQTIGVPGKDAKPTNPAYLDLSMQIRANKGDIEKEKLALDKLEEKYQEIEARVEATPRVEQQYLSLQRNYRQAQAKYSETLAKLQAANEGVELEEENIAEKMTLIDPPQTPEKPHKPNRMLIVLAGVILALMSGVGCGVLAEFLDQSVHSTKDVSQLAQAPMLAVIPRIRSREDRRKARMRTILLTSLAVGGLLALLAAVHFFMVPLDILVDYIINRFSV